MCIKCNCYCSLTESAEGWGAASGIRVSNVHKLRLQDWEAWQRPGASARASVCQPSSARILPAELQVS